MFGLGGKVLIGWVCEYFVDWDFYFFVGCGFEFIYLLIWGYGGKVVEFLEVFWWVCLVGGC